MSVAPAVPSPGSPTIPRRSPPIRAYLTPVALACASAVLLFLAYPPAGLAWLACPALVPLFLLIETDLRARILYAAAWLGGLTFWLASLVWMWELHPTAWIAWIAMGVYQATYWPLFLFLGRALANRCRMPLVIAAPTAWVACEYLQNYALSGFPWYYLAHAVYRAVPFIQISDITGAWGVSFILAMINACLALFARYAWSRARSSASPLDRSTLIQIGATCVVVAVSLIYGAARIRSASFEPGPRVLLLQSNFRQVMKNSLDPARILETYKELIQSGIGRSMSEGHAVNLTVWPETSYPYGYTRIAPGLDNAAIDAAGKTLIPGSSAQEWHSRRDLANEELRQWSDAIGGPMLVGATLFDFTPTGAHRANGAIWIDSRRESTPIYTKMHLVPFGEYIPFYNVVPFIARLAPYDPDHLPRLVAGRAPLWFDDGRFTYAPLICFEDTLPHVARRFFEKTPQNRDPDVLVNISNDGWFNGSAEHDMHLAIGVFRAVENRAPLVRAANMGFTAAIDGNGRIADMVEKATEGFLLTDVPLDSRSAFYSKWGDWFPQICAFFASFAALLQVARSISPRTSDHFQNAAAT